MPAGRVNARVAGDTALLISRASAGCSTRWCLLRFCFLDAGVKCSSVAGVVGVEVLQEVAWRLAVYDICPLQLLLLDAQCADGVKVQTPQ